LKFELLNEQVLRKSENKKVPKMKSSALLLLCVVLSVANAQRGSYAGKRPIQNGIRGDYPTQATNINSRFGDDENQLPLPVDALGDANLVNKLSQLPPEQQPFWLLNYQIIERHRNQPPVLGQPIANRGSFLGRR
jgi:hypothetical protein